MTRGTSTYNQPADLSAVVESSNEATAPSNYVICFVGAGPNTLYCLERLVTRLHSGSLLIPASSLSVLIYDKSGSFGPGIHSKHQPTTNHLNRTAEQVSLCADITHRKLNIEVYEREIETLYQWASEKFKSTNNPRYLIAPQQWVDRALVGEALSETFDNLVYELRELQVAVTLMTSDVVNLVPLSGKKYKIICAESTPENALIADFVFLCTGHTSSKPEAGTFADSMTELSNLPTSSFKYIHNIYPIEKVSSDIVPPSSTVACFGMGLAAIDCINWLTSGRGGYFVSGSNPQKLRYVASGFEPRKIFPISDSGLFVRARAHNEKENFENRRHVGIVFNEVTFNSLRIVSKACGVSEHFIDREVIPLLALEMMMLYYRTLLSIAAVQPIEVNVKKQLKNYLYQSSPRSDASPIWEVYQSAHTQYRDYLRALDIFLTASEGQSPRLSLANQKAISQFLKVRLGSKIEGLLPEKNSDDFLKEAKRLNSMESPWGHDKSILQHVFDWNEVIDPLASSCSETGDLHATAVSWLENDLLNASQGNLSNPIKAAIDGAIRDLRPCFRDQVEWGAGGPSGTRELFSKWYRVTNRLAVGTSLELMKKILALAEVGLVDLSFCRAPTKEIRDGALYLELNGRTGTASVALNAIVHRFNLSLSANELYKNLRSQGIVREWTVSDGVESYSPGSVDVERNSRLIISQDGATLSNMVALGSMVDGPFYYRLALSRPYVADTILFDADQALKSVIAHWSSLQV